MQHRQAPRGVGLLGRHIDATPQGECLNGRDAAGTGQLKQAGGRGRIGPQRQRAHGCLDYFGILVLRGRLRRFQGGGRAQFAQNRQHLAPLGGRHT